MMPSSTGTAPRGLGIAILLLLACTLSLAGCYTTRYSVRGQDVSMKEPTPDERVIHHFEENRRSWYIFWGLLPINENEPLADVARDEAPDRRSRAIRNLEITRQMTFVDGLIQFGESFALGILAAFTSPAALLLVAVLPVPWTTEMSGAVVEKRLRKKAGPDSAPSDGGLEQEQESE